MPSLHRRVRLSLGNYPTIGLVLAAAWLAGGCSLLFEPARPTRTPPGTSTALWSTGRTRTGPGSRTSASSLAGSRTGSRSSP
jgi:hypothetical protein